MYLAIITWKRQKLAKKCQILEKQKNRHLKYVSDFQAWFSATKKKEEKATNNDSFKLDHKLFLKKFQVT